MQCAHLLFTPDCCSAHPLLTAPGTHAMILLLHAQSPGSSQACRQKQAPISSVQSDAKSECITVVSAMQPADGSTNAIYICLITWYLIRHQGSKGLGTRLAAHTTSTHCTFSNHAQHTHLAHTACKCRHFCKRNLLYLMLCPHIEAACMYIMATTFLAPHQLRRRPASPLVHVSITDAACILLQWSI